jgi:hypothetical protein
MAHSSPLAIAERRASAKSQAASAAVSRQFDATDAEINELVYSLYGLSAKEKAIVEREV